MTGHRPFREIQDRRKSAAAGPHGPKSPDRYNAEREAQEQEEKDEGLWAVNQPVSLDTSRGACQMPCDPDCEVAPVHCWNHHRVSWKPDWHDPVACDERYQRKEHGCLK